MVKTLVSATEFQRINTKHFDVYHIIKNVGKYQTKANFHCKIDCLPIHAEHIIRKQLVLKTNVSDSVIPVEQNKN